MRVAAGGCPGWWIGDAERLRPWQIVGEQIVLLVGGQLELGVGEHADQFSGSITTDQRHVQRRLPGEAQTTTDATRADQRRQHDVGVKYPARFPVRG